MSGVRPFDKDTDLRQVADLHRLVFRKARRTPPDELDLRAKYLDEVFLNNPWRDDAMPSLVYEDDQGRIIGFQGVIPRPMLLNGQRLQVALGSQFMVHPQRRGRVGLQLARAFFSGPQDLSICEGNDHARAIWEGLGGTTLLLYSLRWTRPLRPGRYVLSFLKRHGTASVFASALAPLAFAVDGMLGHSARSFRVSPPAAAGEELTEDVLLTGLSDVSRCRSLQPHYEERSLKWLVARLTSKTDSRRFRKVLVRRTATEVAGWYLYHLNPANVGEVVQVAARNGEMRDVLDHLFQDAWHQGAVAVSGQLDPRFIEAFVGAQCLLHSGRFWMLAHANRPERLDVLHRGDAFLTRLEGESKSWAGF